MVQNITPMWGLTHRFSTFDREGDMMYTISDVDIDAEGETNRCRVNKNRLYQLVIPTPKSKTDMVSAHLHFGQIEEPISTKNDRITVA